MPEPKLHVNLSRLDDQERSDLLSRLEPDGRTSGKVAHHERRREPRWIFRRADILVELEHPGGGLSRFLVLARNLSANGMAFIHGGFVHPGTHGQFLLPRVDGPSQPVRGSVVGCRHVEGALHEVRVRFDEPIEPRVFLQPSELVDGASAEPSTVGELWGGIILVAPQTQSIRSVSHALAPTRIELQHAPSVDETRQLLKKGRTDLLLLDLQKERDAALRLVDEVRRLDPNPPLAVLTADTHKPFLTSLMWEGADHVLGKPLSAAELYDVLLRLRRQLRSFV